MKRLAIVMVMLLLGFAASARSIHYFTYEQAARTVQCLNQQNELMIYCGYDYELETYVLVNEVWMERVNSSFFEVWLFGIDAYTGDEVYMPIDLQCIWLVGVNGVAYNAAQYLRFHATVAQPRNPWYIPPYNPYTRRVHYAGYVRTYHYDVHRHGWMPPAPPVGGYGPHTQPPLPPYYMRSPQQPAPKPVEKWTPGVDHPKLEVVSNPRGTSTNHSDVSGSGRTTGSTVRGTSNTSSSGTARTGSSTTSSTTSRGTSSSSTTSTNSNVRGNSSSGTTTSTRGSSSTGTTSSRGTSSTGTTSSRGTSSTGTTSTRGSSSTGTTGSTVRGTSSSSSTSTTRSTANTPTRANTGASTSTTRQSSSSTTSTPASTTRSSSTTSTSSRGTSTTQSGTSRTASGTTSGTTSRQSSSSTRSTTKR